MNRFRVVLMYAALVGLCNAPAEAQNGPQPRNVHMVRPAIGCGTHDEFERATDIFAQQGTDAAYAYMASADCRPFTTFRGQVTNDAKDAICVVGLGNTRCLWFATEAFAPIDH